ncbi:MAG: bifunctional riboflavin kinase/FAD synthetase [Candidatus Marinimicrobia bacterium]|nr:bifunctional riboflavin kinase/FAD synthetase [Candidatus Neomarinimicrobiota bacterium]
MIQVFHGIENLPERFKGSIVALGVFDGLHLAHRKIIGIAIAESKKIGVTSLLVTFDPHPRKVLNQADGFVLPVLTSLPEKIKLLGQTELDAVLFIQTDPEFLKMSPEEFILKILKERLKVRKVVVGYDYRFGKDRAGNATILQEKSKTGGFDVEIVSMFSMEGERVRSSAIRKLLAEGQAEAAWRLLGRPYSLTGKVVKGFGRGHALGFPTANVLPDDPQKLIPAFGVYFSRVHVKNSVSYGMSNLGTRKTFDEQEFAIEVNLFDPPSTDLYGAEIEVELLRKLRDEIKFESADELKKQMIIDKVLCIRIKNEMEDKLNGINERYQARVS